MTADQWQRVRELFEGASMSSRRTRAEWLAVRPPDPRCRPKSNRCIDHHTRAGAFLEDPVAERLPGLFEEDDALDAGATARPLQDRP